MNSLGSKITLHMVSSLDGLIAKPDNSIEWFSTKDHYEEGIEPQNAEAADCYVMGARTYEHALMLSKKHGWPYGDVPTIVVSTRELPIERPNVVLFSGDLKKLVDEKLKPQYRNVWVVGGATLINEFLRQDLADEIRQPILPIILGEGVPFYDRSKVEKPLHLKEVTAFKSGMVELCYAIRK